MDCARYKSNESGLSVVELMIAMALGMLLMVAVGSLFVGTSRSNAELQKSAQQIENGRYAMQVLSEDLKHAGFYGEFSSLPALAGAPDPCETANLATLQSHMALPAQTFRAPNLTTIADVTATTCGGLLPAANLVPGSDVVVVRRADTDVVLPAEATIANAVYLQANGGDAELQLGNGATRGPGDRADGGAATILKKDGVTAGDIRRYHVHVYFVAPCSSGSGANGICAAGDDAIPTLKRLELQTGGVGSQMVIVPMVEGIQFLKAEWGIDNQPNTVNVSTGLVGDGVVDSYMAAPTNAEITNAVAAKIFVLARNTEFTGGYNDDKTYSLGTVAGTTVAAPNDAFKRHAFSTDVLMMNTGGRKEIP